MNDEPHDPMKDLLAVKDQYMTGYREMFIPMFKELNELMKEATLEVEIRAAIIGQAHKMLTTITTATGDRR